MSHADRRRFRNRRRRLMAYLVVALPLVAVSVGCGDDSSDQNDQGQPAGSGDRASASLPTHTHDDFLDMESQGVLRGHTDCLWLEYRGSKTALVFPAGTTAEREGDIVVLVDAEGERVAQTGDEVHVQGAPDESLPSCLGADADAPIVAGEVTAGPIEVP